MEVHSHNDFGSATGLNNLVAKQLSIKEKIGQLVILQLSSCSGPTDESITFS